MSSLCIIFEATGPYNAIGKIAMAQAEAALAAGWKVSIVAKRLHESLQSRVEWLKLYVPPRGFALQWLTARRFIRKALGDPARFDVIHGHQPQIADLCHIYQCHFLTRAAYERGCLIDHQHLRRLADFTQKWMVLHAEDRHYRHRNPEVRMLFVSDLLQKEFVRLYGQVPRARVLENAGPLPDPISKHERDAARRRFLIKTDRAVVGFLGGLSERKGSGAIRRAVAASSNIHLLLGGQFSDGFSEKELTDRLTSVGMVSDTREFYAACDIVAVPSIFDPCPYVVVEAASRGLPVIVTPGVGNAASVVSRGAGELWTKEVKLDVLVDSIMKNRPVYVAAALAWAARSNLQSYCGEMLKIFQSVLDDRSTPARSAPVSNART